jgi:hypothetical protein
LRHFSVNLTRHRRAPRPRNQSGFQARFHTVSGAKQSRNHFLALRKTPATAIWQVGFGHNEEVAMNAIVAGVLTREAAKTQATLHPLTFIALFCGVGLVASFALASMGFDLGTGFF